MRKVNNKFETNILETDFAKFDVVMRFVFEHTTPLMFDATYQASF
jgi:hypothetical protein